MTMIVCFHVITCALVHVVVTAFQQSIISTRHCHHRRYFETKLQASWLPNWLEDFLKADNKENRTEKPALVNIPQNISEHSPSIATIVRLAARKYDKHASRPSSRNYTTRKNAKNSLFVEKEGVADDYNHYRTVALDSTPTRAVSIVTTDVMTALAHHFSIKDGDLGENMLVGGILFDDIQVHEHYKVGHDVILQVTEPMIPCANLCKLPCINNESLSPKERIEKCRTLLEFLDAPGDGFRGWYAQVITGGEITVGDEFRQVENV
jgi:MOSC domain-containing protein YiiM